MSIVRQRRKNGSVYLYESHNVWDKSKKKVRAVRTYLGREDPETGELIPTSKRPGRKPTSQADTTQIEATGDAGMTRPFDTEEGSDSGAVREDTGNADALARIAELEAELAAVKKRA